MVYIKVKLGVLEVVRFSIEKGLVGVVDAFRMEVWVWVHGNYVVWFRLQLMI